MTIKKTINKNDISGASLLKLSGENLTRITNKWEQIHITLGDSGIGGIDEHIDQIEAIRHATSEDIVVIFFSSCPGGNVSSMQSFINAIISTEARVVGVLEGMNASASPMIAVNCDELLITPFSSMMIHSAHYGTGGTVANVERQGVFNAKWLSGLLREIYKDFLTEEELDDAVKGLEIYLEADEISERLKKREEIRKLREEKEESEQDPEVKKAPARKRVKKTT